MRNTPKTFMKRLREAQERVGLSNAEAAGRCRMSRSQYQRYRDGLISPGLEVLDRLADGLSTSPTFLVGGPEEAFSDDRLTAAFHVLFGAYREWAQDLGLSWPPKAEEISRLMLQTRKDKKG